MAKAKKPRSGNTNRTSPPKDVAGKAAVAASDGQASAAPAPSAKPPAAGTVTDVTKAGVEAAKTTSAATTSSVPKTPKPEQGGKTTSPATKAGLAEMAQPEKIAQPEKTGQPDKVVTSSSKPAGEATQKSSAAKVDTKPDTPPKDVAPKTPAPAASVTPPKAQERRSGFVPLVLGGVIAGGLGFAAAEMNFLNLRKAAPSVDTTQITQSLTAQEARIAALENAEPPAVEMPDLSGIAALEESVAAVDARVTALENRPVTDAGENVGPSPEYAEELAALKSSIETQQSEIARLLENALSVEEATAAAAQEAAVQRALATITTALGSGAGFGEAVAALDASGIADVPAALTENAEGVPTLLNLQADFPATARVALSVARSSGEDETAGGFGAFLNRQLGARSVAPREGDDSDAVLSRAEAAVREGRIADALAEIEMLPAPAQEAMAEWLASAQSRAAAEAAVQDLSQRLTSN